MMTQGPDDAARTDPDVSQGGQEREKAHDLKAQGDIGSDWDDACRERSWVGGIRL